MLTLRLSRAGKCGQPSFRLVVQEKQRSPKGKCIEVLGHYMPALKAKPLTVHKERIEHWLSVGAKPSDTVAVLLKKEGFSNMENFIEPRNKKRSKKGAEAPAATPVVPATVAPETPVAQ